MFGQAIQFNGDSFESSKMSFINQTGATLVPGQVYALDVPRANSASVNERSGISNLVAVATSNMGGILIVAEQATPAGQAGLGTVMGYTNVYVSGAGSPLQNLKAVNGQSYLTAVSSAIGNTDLIVAQQWDSSYAQISAPGSAPTLAALTTGGSLAGGQTLYVKTTWVGAGGETTGSAEANVAISASSQAINSVTVTSGVVAPAGAQAMNVYVYTASGQEVFSGTVAAVTGQSAVYTITQLPPSTNNSVPATNTSGIQLVPVFFNGLAFMASNRNPAVS